MGHLKVTGYYHLNIFLIMTITCSRSELSDTGRRAGTVDSYLETQCTEQFTALSQTNWIWATLDWGPKLLGVWIPRLRAACLPACLPGWLAGWLVSWLCFVTAAESRINNDHRLDRGAAACPCLWRFFCNDDFYSRLSVNRICRRGFMRYLPPTFLWSGAARLLTPSFHKLLRRFFFLFFFWY